MLIRQQDEAIIHYVALLGAVLSALGAGFAIWSMPEEGQSAIALQNEISQENHAFNKLVDAGILPDQITVAKAAANDIASDVVKEIPVWSFWNSLPAWQLALISVGGAAMTAGISYGLIWITMYIGSVIMYVFIRQIYGIARRVSPKMAETCGQTVLVEGQAVIQRDPTRIMPILIKLAVLMSLTLFLLAVIVWQMTSLKF